MNTPGHDLSERSLSRQSNGSSNTVTGGHEQAMSAYAQHNSGRYGHWLMGDGAHSLPGELSNHSLALSHLVPVPIKPIVSFPESNERSLPPNGDVFQPVAYTAGPKQGLYSRQEHSKPRVFDSFKSIPSSTCDDLLHQWEISQHEDSQSNNDPRSTRSQTLPPGVVQAQVQLPSRLQPNSLPQVLPYGGYRNASDPDTPDDQRSWSMFSNEDTYKEDAYGGDEVALKYPAHSAGQDDEATYSRPQFGRTTTHNRLFDVKKDEVLANLNAKCDNDYLEEKKPKPHHAIYRRNYIPITATYNLESNSRAKDGLLFVHDPETAIPLKVHALVLAIQGISALHEAEVGTAVVLREFNAARNDLWQPHVHRVRPNNPEDPGHEKWFPQSTGHWDSGKDGTPIKLCTWKRLQFRTATANNGFVARADPKFHKFIVEIRARVGRDRDDDSNEILIATSISGGFQTRGRCPQSFEVYREDDKRHSRRKPPKPEVLQKRMQREVERKRKQETKKLKRALSDSDDDYRSPRAKRPRRIASKPRTKPKVELSTPDMTHGQTEDSSDFTQSSPAYQMGQTGALMGILPSQHHIAYGRTEGWQYNNPQFLQGPAPPSNGYYDFDHRRDLDLQHGRDNSIVSMDDVQRFNGMMFDRGQTGVGAGGSDDAPLYIPPSGPFSALPVDNHVHDELQGILHGSLYNMDNLNQSFNPEEPKKEH